VSSHFVKLTLGPPFSTLAAAFFFYTANNPMTLLISEVSSDVPALLLTILSSVVGTDAVFTPMTQPVFSARILVKLGIVFRLFAFATAFFFDAINNPMRVLILVIASNTPAFFLTILSSLIVTATLSAKPFQSVFASRILVELGLVLKLFTSAATFHSWPSSLVSRP
jgi:hypothetical protein